MKWGSKSYIGFLAFITLLSLIIIFSYKFVSTPSSIDSHTEYAYVPNGKSDNLSVINTTTNEVEYCADIGDDPEGVAIAPDGKKVYVTNSYLNTVSIIDTATNKVVAKVPVGANPMGVAVTPDGKTVYVANYYSSNVSVIDTATNNAKYHLDVQIYPTGIVVTPDGTKVYVANLRSGTVSVIDTASLSVLKHIDVGVNPYGVAVTPDGSKVYVTHDESDKVSVIDTATNVVVAQVEINTGNNTEKRVELSPHGVAVSPDGTKVYVANHKSPNRGISDTPRGSVSIIDTATNKVTDIIHVDKCPCGISINKNGTKVYVANSDSDTVSVIDTVTNKITATVPVGDMPSALGQFIGSPPKVPEHNPIRESINSVIESISRTIFRINEVINGVEGLIIGIISTVSYGILLDSISPSVTEILEPRVRKKLKPLLDKILNKKQL
ncbi:YncE family protein [Methanosarcina sp. UBA411]|jgi:YVTN family beta-propeller protein|uniref:YncE family protein n=1 Tax=Methanosarcina sp. UBA411 TaxID=1915589 RepID=UPI0025DE89F3|nr:YncE family protein [Methanosarcina sp. UBA411]